MIKTIAFDIGEVLIHPERSIDEVYEEFARAIGAPPEEVAALRNEYFKRMIVGKVSANDFFAIIKKKFKTKGDLKSIWIRVGAKRIILNKQLLRVVDKLRVQYRLVILSNVTQVRSLIDEEFDLYSHFDRAFLSYKLKMKKPSKRIFLYTLKKLNAHPGEVLFIDDKESNLKVARELGIKSIQFNNNAQLTTELTRLGLL